MSDLNEAVKYYWRTNRPEFSSLIAGLALAEVQRGARMIPGITITEIRKAL